MWGLLAWNIFAVNTPGRSVHAHAKFTGGVAEENESPGT